MLYFFLRWNVSTKTVSNWLRLLCFLATKNYSFASGVLKSAKDKKERWSSFKKKHLKNKSDVNLVAPWSLEVIPKILGYALK